jgi:hypothetical protein
MAEVVGLKTQDASTLFTVLNSAGSIPLIYMIWLEGVGYRRFGVHGLLWTDAVSSLLVFAIVVTVYLHRGLGLKGIPVLENL